MSIPPKKKLSDFDEKDIKKFIQEHENQNIEFKREFKTSIFNDKRFRIKE